jgi:hypothetical protein
MQGSGSVRFSELFADTVNTHGIEWAKTYYTKRGMQEWEFNFWLNSRKLKDIRIID